MKGHPCTCINKKLSASLCTTSLYLIILSWIGARRERVKLLARLSGLGFYYCTVLGFISHGEIIVLALYFVDESILKKSGFSSPRGFPRINLYVSCLLWLLNVSWCKCFMIIIEWKTDNRN